MLIPRLGIIGLITTTLVAGIPSLVIGLWWIRKHYNVTVDWASSAKIYLSSGITAIITYIITSQLNLQNWIQLTAGGIIFLATYLTITPLTGAIKQSDINNLREILTELEPLSHLFNLPLRISEKILTIKH